MARALSPRGFPEAFIGASTFNLGSGGHPDDDIECYLPLPVLPGPFGRGSYGSRIAALFVSELVVGARRPTIIHLIPKGTAAGS